MKPCRLGRPGAAQADPFFNQNPRTLQEMALQGVSLAAAADCIRRSRSGVLPRSARALRRLKSQ
jgi:hypothetical protein